jgi:hypothetical protein
MYTNQHLQLQDPSKFTKIGIFDLKICHLATLEPRDGRNVAIGLFSTLNLQSQRGYALNASKVSNVAFLVQWQTFVSMLVLYREPLNICS